MQNISQSNPITKGGIVVKPDSLRFRLSVETAAAHAKLQKCTVLNELIAEVPKGEVTEQQKRDYQEAYSKFLLLGYAMELAFERRVRDNPLVSIPMAKLGLEFENPRGTERVADDLRGLGCSIDLGQIAPAPLDPVETLEQGLAEFYVMLGSRYGGTTVAKIATMYMGPNAPRAYLGFHGAMVAPNIETQLALFEGAPRSPEFDARVIGAANTTFDQLTAWMMGLEQSEASELSGPQRVARAGARFFDWLRN